MLYCSSKLILWYLDLRYLRLLCKRKSIPKTRQVYSHSCLLAHILKSDGLVFLDHSGVKLLGGLSNLKLDPGGLRLILTAWTCAFLIRHLLILKANSHGKLKRFLDVVSLPVVSASLGLLSDDLE